MLGEQLTACDITPAGLKGDRAFALVDQEDGKVASAKSPRKWGALLEFRARFLEDATVEIAFPDGSTVRSDDPLVDEVLSAAAGRPVRLASAAPEAAVFEEVWPAIDGLAPEEIIAGTNIGTDEAGERISQFPLAGAAPAGTFFDLAVLHLMTGATLAQLARLNPSGTFDVRRYRPNLILDVDDASGFIENEWVGRILATVGGVRIRVSLPTMRCVMTTLAQADLPEDRSTLRTIADHNRVEIPGLGVWACAGAYAEVVEAGTLEVGAELSLV